MVDFAPIAGGLELRVDQQVLQRVHRSVRYVRILEQLDPLRIGAFGAEAGQRCVILLDVLQAVGHALEALILGKVLAPDQRAELLPVTVGVGQQREITVLRRIGTPLLVEHALVARRVECGHKLLAEQMLDHDEGDQRLEHRHFDRLSLAGLLARIKRRQYRRDDAVGAGLVGNDRGHEARLVGDHGLQRGKTRARLDDVVIGGLRSHRSRGAVAVGGEINEARIDLLELLVLDAEALGGRRPIVVHQHVSGLGELEQRLAPALLLEVEHDRTLGAIAAKIERGHAGMTRRSHLTRRIAFRRLDLDHVGAEIAQLLRGPRPEHDRGAVDDTKSSQRARHCRSFQIFFSGIGSHLNHPRDGPKQGENRLRNSAQGSQFTPQLSGVDTRCRFERRLP